MAGKRQLTNFSVEYEGVDGTSTTRFSSLKAAGAYIKDRYLGAEYIRGKDGLQGEYGFFTMNGFTWADLGSKTFEDDGCPIFRWFIEFGGDLDPRLDPEAAGDFAIIEVHYRYGGYDEVIGSSRVVVTRAKSIADVRAKLAVLEQTYETEGMDYNPWEVSFKGKPVYFPYSSDPVEQARLDAELEDKLYGRYVEPVVEAGVSDTIPF